MGEGAVLNLENAVGLEAKASNPSSLALLPEGEG
jgi:hypothetical protein